MSTIADTPLQSYIKNKGLQSAKDELHLEVYEHPTLPLLGFSYHQIDSPKYNPAVIWARGTVLEKDTYKVVAQPFRRFFNYPEGEDAKSFNWYNCNITSKEDGSLIILFNYRGNWYAKCSGSWGLQNFCNEKPELGSFQSYFSSLLSKYSDIYKFDKDCTYCFELVSPYNKIVTPYKEPALFLLTAFNTAYYPYEFGLRDLEYTSKETRVPLPDRHIFSSANQVLEYLQEYSKENPTFEGFVATDNQHRRLKLKSESYMSLHHMLGNGVKMYHPRYIVPRYLRNEDVGEILNYFPEFREDFEKVKETLDKEYANLKSVWEKSYKIENRKDFALYINPKTKLTKILFHLRDLYGTSQTESNLREQWAAHESDILKVCFGVLP